MKRISKIILCALSIALVLCSCVAPCFAIDWKDEIGQTQLVLLPSPSQALVDGWASEESARLLSSMVDNAYADNAFNGRRPLAITFYSVSGSPVYIKIITCSLAYPLANYEYIQTRLEYAENDSLMSFKVEPIDGASTTGLKLYVYDLMVNGSFQLTTTSGVASVNIGQDSGYLLYAYTNNGNWIYNPTSDFFVTSYGLPGNQIPIDGVLTEPSQTAPAELTEMASKWQPEEIIIEHPQYTLDIPGIITAVPNGAKQIINNAFGFEIFGINVAGLLSVVLVVSIVAFVVKWLMSR